MTLVKAALGWRKVAGLVFTLACLSYVLTPDGTPAGKVS